MATDTVPTSLQTGTTPNPIPSNAQDFSDSDDEIMDNFAAGHDDGTPMGLGGEKGRQAEPASSTLEADIINGTTKQPGEDNPPDDAAASEPVQEDGEVGSEDVPEPGTPETPDFPPALLQMAGLADASAAQAAGFKDPDALFAAIKWRGQLLTPGAQPAQLPEGGLYRRPTETTVRQEPVVEESDVKPFQLPSDKMELLDEDLQEVIRQMNDHYQKEVSSLRSSLAERESEIAGQQGHDEEIQFDEVLRNLGDDWKDVFGEGSGAELARAGQTNPVAMTNFNHRALMYDAVQAVREVNAKQGYKPMDLQQEVQWALMQRYPDKFQQIISGSSKPSQRSGVTASRPTQRNTPPKSQNSKLLKSVDAMLRKRHGYGLDMGHEEEHDGDI